MLQKEPVAAKKNAHNFPALLFFPGRSQKKHLGGGFNPFKKISQNGNQS